MKPSSHPKASSQPALYAWDAHHRFIAAVIMAVIAFLGLQGRVSLPTQLAISWDVFALSVVVLAWMVICTKDPYEARRNARLQDSSATFLFVLVISAATASLLAVGLLLGSAKDLSHAGLAAHIGLSIAGIVLSWALVHTLFALRYAHAYFHEAHKLERTAISGGLIFPGKGPDYLDFAFFSFVVGMTCQVSDVQVACRPLRRMVMVHGLISFAFNTAILAMFVNIIANLI